MNRAIRSVRYRSMAQFAELPLVDIALGGDWQRGELRLAATLTRRGLPLAPN